jgi:hypothetical protein
MVDASGHGKKIYTNLKAIQYIISIPYSYHY